MSSPDEKPHMKDRILRTADRLFYLRGIRAVGVDTVAAEIGISKRTLYNHYPSKDALILAYLMRRFVTLETSDAPPVDQIFGVFDALEQHMRSRNFRGCAFVNAVTELGAEDRAVAEIAIAFKESRRVWFRDLLAQLGAADADGLATQISLIVDGCVVQALVRGDRSIPGVAKQAAAALMAHAGLAVPKQGETPRSDRTGDSRA